jgi:hypothetical protein
MIFPARQSNPQAADDNAPPGRSHPNGTKWHAAPGTRAAWPLPIACLVAELAQPADKWCAAPFRLPPTRRAYTRRGGWAARLGSPVVTVTRLQSQPARVLPPKRLTTPRSAAEISPRDWGLLPGAPTPTRAGLTPAGLIQLARRNIGPSLCVCHEGTGIATGRLTSSSANPRGTSPW